MATSHKNATAISEPARALVTTLKDKIRLPKGRFAVIVNLDHQKAEEKEILIPDKVDAMRDRRGRGEPRLAWVVASTHEDVQVGSTWLVDANEGQWWMPHELKRIGLSLPEGWQLRFYMNEAGMVCGYEAS